MAHNMFEEIDKTKEELPDFKKVKKTVTKLQKKNYNFYQVIAIIIMGIGFIGGIILGNIVSTCSRNIVNNGVCLEDGFNIGFTFAVWTVTFLFSLFLYSIGHIISLLEEISKKIS